MIAPRPWRDHRATGHTRLCRFGAESRAGPTRAALERYAPRATSAAISAASVGDVPTRTPAASSASFFACAVPDEQEMIAHAWPIVFPGGALNPAM
jgi:hypothetical protein